MSLLVNCLFVGMGGFVGAVCRYLMGFLPVGGASASGFPLVTFAVNVLGALAIGLIAATFAKNVSMNPQLLLFLKVGVCGGFTTFSTFSLETLQLLEQGNWAMAAFYAGASVIACLAACALGMWLAR
ncbi:MULTISPECIES: fluoride efflux transporter CrcB [unclassified Adlercreutzia]|uniref:fluoride efflux transporter CrcB n=1 Tax=unclassified Adlercreutzia TaxID=2636013 RepID=UPI0013ED6543|nr:MULTISPECIES: fluoride efflux transporter CrcB [unclassified Adlercreutzia]